MRVGGKRTKPLSIEVLCDWAERAQPTPTQFQRRRVYYFLPDIEIISSNLNVVHRVKYEKSLKISWGFFCF